jgi:hypothetical protein
VTGLPYPTPTRLRLAEAIREGDVRHYHWEKPWTCDIPRDRNVTARVAEFVAAGLASLGEPTSAVRAGGTYSAVTMTELGDDWYLRAMRGPGSTSPEPGPDECDHSATERQGEAMFCADCGVMLAGPDGEMAP